MNDDSSGKEKIKSQYIDHPENYVTKLKNIKQVIEELQSFQWAKEIIQSIDQFIENQKYTKNAFQNITEDIQCQIERALTNISLVEPGIKILRACRVIELHQSDKHYPQKYIEFLNAYKKLEFPIQKSADFDILMQKFEQMKKYRSKDADILNDLQDLDPIYSLVKIVSFLNSLSHRFSSLGSISLTFPHYIDIDEPEFTPQDPIFQYSNIAFLTPIIMAVPKSMKLCTSNSLDPSKLLIPNIAIEVKDLGLKDIPNSKDLIRMRSRSPVHVDNLFKLFEAFSALDSCKLISFQNALVLSFIRAFVIILFKEDPLVGIPLIFYPDSTRLDIIGRLIGRLAVNFSSIEDFISNPTPSNIPSPKLDFKEDSNTRLQAIIDFLDANDASPAFNDEYQARLIELNSSYGFIDSSEVGITIHNIESFFKTLDDCPTEFFTGSFCRKSVTNYYSSNPDAGKKLLHLVVCLENSGQLRDFNIMHSISYVSRQVLFLNSCELFPEKQNLFHYALQLQSDPDYIVRIRKSLPFNVMPLVEKAIQQMKCYGLDSSKIESISPSNFPEIDPNWPVPVKHLMHAIGTAIQLSDDVPSIEKFITGKSLSVPIFKKIYPPSLTEPVFDDIRPLKMIPMPQFPLTGIAFKHKKEESILVDLLEELKEERKELVKKRAEQKMYQKEKERLTTMAEVLQEKLSQELDQLAPLINTTPKKENSETSPEQVEILKRKLHVMRKYNQMIDKQALIQVQEIKALDNC